MEDGRNDKANQAHVLFDRFVQATTCKGTVKSFQELCDYLELKPRDYRSFYHKLKSKLNYWKAKALWSKLDKRSGHKDYKKGKACSNTKCLIIGAGPCGLRTAIELGFLGAKVVVVEKRDAFSRNNVLHLWPFTIHDLRGLGAKKFYGKFCAGAIDHISIRQLQLILLKVSLILGIEIHVNVEFQGLIEPPEEQENERIGWRAKVHPKGHPISEYDFDVIIGADGRRNTLAGFRRKEFRGKLAIAITANFINRNTTAEAKVEEISGVAFIFNQKFFQELREATGIDLENIVYYKDDTHYFVMTAKKQSLLEKGVILQDYADTEMLLSRANVDQEALQNYATEAARFSTHQQLPTLDFAINHYGQPDVAMFDFTCMYASENAGLVRERHGHRLLVALVGDSLLEPFWPMGTGIARGFLAAMDSAWMVRSWAYGASPPEVLAERESIYRLLPQTTPENVSKNFSQYSLDPTTRYPNVNLQFLRPSQVRHLYYTGEMKDVNLEIANLVNAQRTPKLGRNESVARTGKLLSWCQKQTDGYAGVSVTDLTMSWKSGLALCAIIHRYRPELIDFGSLDERNVEKNNQLAFDIAERELGISPIMTGKEMASVGEPDKLSMVVYLSQFYEMFKETTNAEDADQNLDEKAALLASTKSPISFLSKLGQTISRKRTPKDKKEKEVDSSGKRRKTSQSEDEDGSRPIRDERPLLVGALTDRRMEATAGNQNKVKSMATQLLAKFEENAPAPNTGLRKQASFRKEFPQNLGGSDVCYFCHRRVYVMERLSAEGKFFHRSCFKCDYCNTTLRLSCYAYDLEDGKFYCKPHYCYRRSGYSQRKRAAAPAQVSKELKGPAKDTPDAEDPGRAPTLPLAAAEKTPGPSINCEDHTAAKRLRATPERIELENYRVSMQKEELEEVPEETLAEHNLSSLLDKGGQDEEEAASSSSESEMEEDEEEDEEEEDGYEPAPSSDLGGVPWKEAVKIHAKLKGRSLDEMEADRAVDPGVGEDEEEDDEDDDEEEPSSEAGNLRLQQALTPVDPMEIKVDVHWTHVHKVRQEQDGVNTEGEEVGTSSPSKVACEDEEAEAEVLGTGLLEAGAGGDGDTSADLGDDDDIPSDAEAEERLQQSERLRLRLDEGSDAPSRGQNESDRGSCAASATPEPEVFSPKAESEKVSVLTPKEQTSPSIRFFPDPYVPRAGSKASTPLEPKAFTPVSPVCSQPTPTQELVTPTSPTKSSSIPPLLRPMRSPSSPICSQPLPSTEVVTIPPTTKSPVCLQPSPVITSTPLAKLPFSSHVVRTDSLTSPNSEEALKRIDLIEEFWTKSAEIRRSLGLTPVERSRTSEVSFQSMEPSAARTPVSKASQGDLKSPPLITHHVLKKVNPSRLDPELLSPLTPISPSEKELKSSEGERRDLSTSSGLGLNGSNSNTRTAASESFNTSDSALLTPPSSPPPPPPQGEEPATLQKCLASWQNGPESIPSPLPQAKVKSPDVPQPPKLEEVRKSFVESVDEIPFADDVEDTYDERTDNSSLHERFFTPPTSRTKLQRLPLTKENGELPSSVERGRHRKRLLPQLTTEAKELAEERMRAREKSVKSAALRDVMAQQLHKMKQLETVQAPHRGSVLSSTKLSPRLPAESRALAEAPTLRLGTADELFLSSLPAEGSITSSEGSGGGKPKKRPSLFSPRKKEKKSKGEMSRLSDKQDDGTKPKSLWKSVFSGYKKEKKKKKSADEKSTPSTPSSTTTVDSGNVKVSNVVRGAELPLRRHLSFSEDSDLSSDDVLEKSSQKSKREKTYTDEELNAKLTKRVQKAARRQAKQEELKRLHRAQIIQRQLEQVEEKQRQLEERGVAVEKALRGEAGMGKKDDPKLMQEWFRLVQEKNALVRYESELMIFARELELEDRQSRLQQELRERMAVEDQLKSEQELTDEKQILNEMLDVVEQRDALVALLEEQRLREKEEDKDLEEVMLSKGYNLNWS
ncbi:F-actin-monooxygenase MICAL3 isoform X3 [Ranitomeya imitator]|uniref:F-actin-monooxygenase MICAL3 isoform X3 n=1 Tax=Ranitomeya imitator TaxID=111125 RepID=UPI0037E89F2A